MSDVYQFDQIVKSAHIKVQAEDWQNAEHDISLVSALNDLDVNQNHFIYLASIYIRQHDKTKFEEAYHALKNGENTPDFKLHLGIKEWLLQVRPDLLRVFTNWIIGFWLFLILVVTICYGQCTFPDLICTLALSFVSAAGAAILMFNFHLNRRDFFKDVGILVVSYVLIPLVYVLFTSLFLDHH